MKMHQTFQNQTGKIFILQMYKLVIIKSIRVLLLLAILFIIIFLSYPSSPNKNIFPSQEPRSSSRGNDMKMKTENEGGVDELSKPYPCNDCDKRFRQKSHLTVHQRCLHSLDKPFMCPYCGKLFAVASNHKKVFMYI